MSGRKMLEIGQRHIGEKYVFGALVPKDKEDYAGPWDCAEFVTWAVFQVSQKLYGCANNDGDPSSADSYTGFWARDAKKLGKIVTINEALQTPGAAILRIAGNGAIGHIVISDGKGGTVEAHSTKTGVINSVVSGRRWDYGVLVPWIEYEQTTIPNVKGVNKKPAKIIYRLTKPLMKGPEIKEIQKRLGISADGIFGPQTFNAVRSFQNAEGLTPDGEVGPKTLAELGLNF